MSALSRIRSTLNAAACVSDQVASVPDLSALLERLNRTVLPRHIELRFESGATMALFVHNRRLYRMTGDASAPAPWGAALGAGDEGLVADTLKEALSGDVVISISETALRDGMDGTGLGIAATSLMEETGTDQSGSVQPDLAHQLVAFTNQHAAKIEASFLMEGYEIAPLSGAEDAIERRASEITDILARATSDESPLAATLETDGALAFPCDPADEACVLLVGRVGTYGAVLFQQTSAQEALTYWQAA